MAWFTSVVVFIGCFVMTSGVHIFMMNKMDEYIDKYFEHGSEGRKDFESFLLPNCITLGLLFSLTLVASGFIILNIQTM